MALIPLPESWKRHVRQPNQQCCQLEAGGIAPAWVDYDNDGYLDVFFANGGKTNALYRNLDGTGFTNVSAGAGVNYKASFTLHSAWGDFDNDGWQDLFVANNGNDFLFNNNADGTFTRILP